MGTQSDAETERLHNLRALARSAARAVPLAEIEADAARGGLRPRMFGELLLRRLVRDGRRLSGARLLRDALALHPALLDDARAGRTLFPEAPPPGRERLDALAGKVLDESYDLEMVEVHHRMKKDAPSGTAMKLLEILLEARGRDIKKDVIYGRRGETGAREKGKIGVLALRGGDVVGDHTVSFLGDGERIELVHKASSREAFARGALLAAKFLAKKKQGLYHMQEVLGIS